MGALTLPTSGVVYIDTMTLICTVERFRLTGPCSSPYGGLLKLGPLRLSAAS